MAKHSLQAVAQLSGSFAVGGLLARELQLSSALQEAADAAAALFLPGNALAYTIRRTTPSIRQKSAATFYALDSDGRYRKVYPVELRVKSATSQFGISYFRLALLRALLVTYAPMLDGYFKELQRMERDAEEKNMEVDWDELPGFDWREAKARLPQVAFAMVRDAVVSVVRGLLTQGAATYLHSRLVWKLIKDQTASLRSKRRIVFYKRPFAVTQTVLRGSVISTVAEGLVSSVIDAARILHSRQIPQQHKPVVLRRRVVARSLSLMVSLVSSSAAAGVVGLVRPGVACVGVSLAAGFATDVFVCMPAAQEYESKGRVSRQTTVVIVASSAVVLWAFLPWIAQPSTSLHPSVFLQPAAG